MTEHIDQENQSIGYFIKLIQINTAVYTHCSIKSTVSLRSITSETDNQKLNHRGKLCLINFFIISNSYSSHREVIDNNIQKLSNHKGSDLKSGVFSCAFPMNIIASSIV